jgi:hypothetical protein
VSNSAAPTLEYRRHHPVEAPRIDSTAFRPAWRRVDRLDQLLVTGVITPQQRAAAAAFRALYEHVHAGDLQAQDLAAMRTSKHCGRSPERPLQRLGAVRRLSEIAKALGALYPLLVMVVIEELSWCESAGDSVSPAKQRRFGRWRRSPGSQSCLDDRTSGQNLTFDTHRLGLESTHCRPSSPRQRLVGSAMKRTFTPDLYM